MATEEQSLGLCSTCNSSSVCTRRAGMKFPVLFCEEFDDSTPVVPKRQRARASADGNASLDTAMGLCCNCGNRGSCTLCHSPGGVWHCEEYC
jgi:hypothetical protein